MKINKRLFLKSILFGIVLSLILFAIAYILLPQTWVTQAYLFPGLILGSPFGLLISTKIIYWLVPEGGGPAFILVSLIAAVLFWLLLFAMIHYFWQSRRLKSQNKI